MAKFQLNHLVQNMQRRTLLRVVSGVIVTITAVSLLVNSGKKNTAPIHDKVQISPVVDELFSDATMESALSLQQTEFESLKTQVRQLNEAIEKSSQLHARELQHALHEVEQQFQQNTPGPQSIVPQAMHHPMPTHVHALSFHYETQQREPQHLSPQHYVPSGTFVRAVVLGGADADASVNGQSKNNGVMLFKLMQPGTLPNGQRSHLQGCFVTASSYGDISSERAYVILDKLSCAQKDMPIIDKHVTGWAFFGGKVGIKGMPLMRDNKVMQWAGISGALSGIAAVAQYSQSVQNMSPLGSSSTLPSANAAPYAAYGGASKAAEVLSNYYVKRAEQYHPVIQVGSGNIVTIVFKDGFYLEPDDAVVAKGHRLDNTPHQPNNEPDFEVPPEVLRKIGQSYDQKPEIES